MADQVDYAPSLKIKYATKLNIIWWRVNYQKIEIIVDS